MVFPHYSVWLIIWVHFLLCSYALSVTGLKAFLPDTNNTKDIELLFSIFILFTIFLHFLI